MTLFFAVVTSHVFVKYYFVRMRNEYYAKNLQQNTFKWYTCSYLPFYLLYTLVLLLLIKYSFHA